MGKSGRRCWRKNNQTATVIAMQSPSMPKSSGALIPQSTPARVVAPYVPPTETRHAPTYGNIDTAVFSSFGGLESPPNQSQINAPATAKPRAAATSDALIFRRRLTVKLRGRTRRQAALRSNETHRALPTRPEGRRGRTLSPGARGAKHEAPHGPLQRLLGADKD